MSVLSQMVAQGTLTKDTLVWTQGMQNWAKAEMVAELKNLFQNVVPPVPPTL